VRLWLQTRTVAAPFAKLILTFMDEAACGDWRRHVALVPPTCEVTYGLPVALLREHATDHRWVMARVLEALALVAETKGWRSIELEQAVTEFAALSPPVRATLPIKPALHRPSGWECELWISLGARGHTAIGARLNRGAEDRDVVLRDSPEPVFLEDDFPVAMIVPSGEGFHLLTRTREVLARIPIEGRLNSH
jgi:hypothetical protein